MLGLHAFQGSVTFPGALGGDEAGEHARKESGPCNSPGGPGHRGTGGEILHLSLFSRFLHGIQHMPSNLFLLPCCNFTCLYLLEKN